MSAASALLAWAAPTFAQTEPPPADCMKTETQAECHARLKCKPDEELDECKERRAREEKEGGRRDVDGDGDVDEDDAKERRRRRERGDEDADGDVDEDDDKERRRRRERDDVDGDGDVDEDDAKERRRRRERGDDDDDRPRARDRDDDDDDGDDFVLGEGEPVRGGDDRDGVLRPGTRPGFLSAGIGPSFGFCYRGDCAPGDLDYGAWYGTLDFGWHFSGDFEGPAIGVNIHGGFGSLGPADHNRLGAGFKFWWDIPMGDDIGLYFTPFAQAGWTSFLFEQRGSYLCGPPGSVCDDGEHFVNLQLGAMLRFILGDRGLLYVQPITFDNAINGDGYGLLYRLELGGGVTFGG